MKNINEFESRFGFVKFNGKDFVLKELMKSTGKLLSKNTIEMSAHAVDDNGNTYVVYWKYNNSELEELNYDKVDRVEEIVTFYITVDDENGNSLASKDFTVPYEWTRSWIKDNHDMTLDQFLEEYTSEESEQMYCDAILQGVLIS